MIYTCVLLKTHTKMIIRTLRVYWDKNKINSSNISRVMEFLNFQDFLLHRLLRGNEFSVYIKKWSAHRNNLFYVRFGASWGLFKNCKNRPFLPFFALPEDWTFHRFDLYTQNDIPKWSPDHYASIETRIKLIRPIYPELWQNSDILSIWLNFWYIHAFS